MASVLGVESDFGLSIILLAKAERNLRGLSSIPQFSLSQSRCLRPPIKSLNASWILESSSPSHQMPKVRDKSPNSEVRLEGLSRVPTQMERNTVRSAKAVIMCLLLRFAEAGDSETAAP